MATKKPRMIQVAVTLDEDQWRKLRAAASRLRVPAAVLIRMGIDSVLEATADRAIVYKKR